MEGGEVSYTTTHFTGRVQGVGFRYLTLQVAKEFDLSGTVRNLADGRVFLDVEGEPEEIKGFLAEVEDRLQMFIRKAEHSSGRRSARYSGFRIS